MALRPHHILAGAAARSAHGTSTLSTLRLPPVFLRTTFLDPLTEEDIPLPEHRWVAEPIGEAPASTLVSHPSGAEGRAQLDLDAAAHHPRGAFQLRWEPVGAALGPAREVWIDLDAHAWVESADVQPLERRRLVRLVAFSTAEKAHHGGFVHAPTPRFLELGILGGNDWLPLMLFHGTPSTALHMRVDHGLFRAFMRFVFYDTLNEEMTDVPPGLVVEATDGTGAVVGAGTAVRDGLTHVLHARPPSTDLHYRFVTPAPHAIVRFSDEPIPRRDITVVDALPSPRRARYVLPSAWHTLGWEASLANASGASFKGPFVWPRADEPAQHDLRDAITSPAEPLEFCLDDTVLADEKRALRVIAPGATHTVFDQLLAVRNPDAAFPHTTATELRGNYFPGLRDIIPPPPRKLARLTRLFDLDGVVHGLGDERVQGTMGETPTLGARMAVALDDPHALLPNGMDRMKPPGAPGGCYELHLIETLLDSFDYVHKGRRATVRLFHLLVHISAFIHEPPGRVHELLDPSARFWDPADTSPSGEERFVIVPRGDALSGAVTDGCAVVFPRFFFGHIQAPRRGKITIVVGNDHPGFNGVAKILHLRADLLEDDSVFAPRFLILAHELGHALDLFDEYKHTPSLDSHVPMEQGFIANSNARPFYSDGFGVMVGRASKFPAAPRLRYLWHFVRELEHNGAFQKALAPASAGPLRLVADSDRKGTLPHMLPNLLAAKNPLGEGDHPWKSAGTTEIPRGKARANLFRVGQDRDVSGRMWGAPRGLVSPDGSRFLVDGVLTLDIDVRIHGSRLEHRDAAAARLHRVVDKDEGRLAELAYPPFFIIAESKRAALAHIGVLLGFNFVSGDGPHLSIALLSPNDPEPTVLATPPPQRQRAIALRIQDMTAAVLRYALGVPTVDAAGKLRRGPLTLADMRASSLIEVVNGILNEPNVPRRFAQRGRGGAVAP